MTNPFSFDVPYNHFAHRYTMQGLPKSGIVEPSVTLVFIEDGKVYRETQIPNVSHFFQSREGKAALGSYISGAVHMPLENEKKDFCVVVISEAYMVMGDLSKGESVREKAIAARQKLPKNLADAPESVEVLSIIIHHRSGAQVGALPINPDRSVTYRPLMRSTETFGDLTPGREDRGTSH